MNNLTPEAIKLLQRVKCRILKEPRQFQMHAWFLKKDNIPNCKTAACIAGWTATFAVKSIKPLNGAKKVLGSKFYGGSMFLGASGWTNSVMLTAKKSLGLNQEQAGRLFKFLSWPQQFRQTWDEGTFEYVKQAADRIDHFITTDGRE